MNDVVAKVAATALYAALAVAAALAAYHAIFTGFAPQDDEGTLLVSLARFVDGDALYRDVYSPYGPFYYELFGGLFALTGWTVSTDAGRLLTVAVWLLTSGLFGLVVQRLSGSLLLGGCGAIVAFGVLAALTGEPMHPHGLGVLLLGAFALLVASGPGRHPTVAGALAGSLLAALVLTKVNVGAYAIAAAVLAAVLTVEPLQRRAWLRWPVALAFLAMPLVVMARDLPAGWVRELLVLELLAGLALLLAARSLRPPRGEGDPGTVRWLLAAAAGLPLAALLVVAAIAVAGTSPADLYDGVVVQALRIRDALIGPFLFRSAALGLGVAAVGAAVFAVWLGGRQDGLPPLWSGLLRAAAGLTIWLTISQAPPLGLDPGGNQIVVPMLLAWVAVVPPRGAPPAPFARFARLLLPALAIAETLQAYPVAGAQVGIAALTFVPVGALCLGDALTSLRTWNEERGPARFERFGAVLGVFVFLLGAKLAVDEISDPAAESIRAYRDAVPVSFDGANRLRLSPAQAREYERVVALLHANRCTALIGYPNVNSLYLWASIEPPRPAPPGAWITALTDAEQEPIVARLRASSRPCAIRDRVAAAGWLAGRPTPDAPLVDYILEEFEPIEEIGGIEFMLPAPGATGESPLAE